MLIEKHKYTFVLLNEMYNPEMLEDHVRRLYKLKKFYGMPMTIIHNSIVEFGLSVLELKVYDRISASEPLLNKLKSEYPNHTIDQIVSSIEAFKKKGKSAVEAYESVSEALKNGER